ncbi:endogenous retrovirus group k member 8 gag poly [Limosa lapponica baueri]|uniref:Endogenous retrovirus group k member 8 gag poly n=1 Tax=Limosa lapponica baueri TaxID=1758121 RepID=A0A2I0UIM3_LIMLA|nr:endogenous retrovirus group k member 8 gag poly [Limosa lapponica baueri]
METEAAATLLTGILSKRGNEIPVKLLIKLIKLGQRWGHFSDTHMLFSVSEWRDFGGTMWQKTIKGNEKEEKEIKAVRKLWNTVLETLKVMKVEREVACAAAQMLGPGAAALNSQSKPGPIARFFGLLAVKGMTGTVCKTVAEIRANDAPDPPEEGKDLPLNPLQNSGKAEVSSAKPEQKSNAYAEVPPQKTSVKEGPETSTDLIDLGGAACRPPPTAPPPAAPPPLYPPLPSSSDSSGPPTPPGNKSRKLSSDATDKVLQTVLRRLEELDLRVGRKDDNTPSWLVNPSTPPRTTRWSGVIRDAILEGQWETAANLGRAPPFACPVVHVNESVSMNVYSGSDVREYSMAPVHE